MRIEVPTLTLSLEFNPAVDSPFELAVPLFFLGNAKVLWIF